MVRRTVNTSLEPGTGFGKYEIERRLARGGMGEVWLAKSIGPQGFAKQVVIKTVLPYLADNPAYINMLVNEASLAARLNHPNIVQVFDLGCVDGTYFIAMEYVSGRTLQELFRRAARTRQVIPPWLTMYIIGASCDGLQYAHDYVDEATDTHGLLHRDVSPSNLMIGFAGQVTILDFGIATANCGDGCTQSGTIKGKYHYMPPERIRGEPSDRTSDVYSLGVVMYQMLTWERPFTAETDYELLHKITHDRAMPPSARAPWIPPELDAIVMTAMAPRPRDRYPSARRFGDAVRAFARKYCETHVTADAGRFVSRLFADDEDLPIAVRRDIESDDDEPIDVTDVSIILPDGEDGLDIPIEEFDIELSVVEDVPDPPSLGGLPDVPARTPRGSIPPRAEGSAREPGTREVAELFRDAARRPERPDEGLDVFANYSRKPRREPTEQPWPFASRLESND